MESNHKISPEEPFPEDLTALNDTEVEILNSRIHRELEAEYADGLPDPETEARLEEVNLELNRREQEG
ncbi:hypothetical protein GC088_14505 [Arthrobacter sp. JZ12]|uniref:hypothetical protein n=1 Tax=Arthrobacter sp. JZ12 TaxID=2654190 RepID=UPI002B48B251|nr:hypothetical protein [Arthrobacter sp. JZ12]WRH26158.1 hypothetical protein GC088_14505 [Arthrobacter sp. JZ12]